MDSLTLAAHCVTKGHHSRDAHNTFCRGPLHYQACKLDQCELERMRGEIEEVLRCSICDTPLNKREEQIIRQDLDFVPCRGGDHLISLAEGWWWR